MPRPPLAQPLFFFFLLLVLGGAGGALGSFWWTARWHSRDVEAIAALESEAANALRLKESEAFGNRPGWLWLIEPMDWSPWKTASTEGGVLAFSSGDEGVDVFLARTESLAGGASPARLDAVAFDASNRRMASVEALGAGSSADAVLRHYRFPPEDAPAKGIAWIGIEAVAPSPIGRSE